MPKHAFDEVLQFLKKACALQGTCNLSDRELLERFLRNRDEGALTFLVRRHGPMMFGICKRLVGNCHDAEDAVQAAFLVLVQRTRSIRRKESIGSWLCGVAQRTALRTRAQNTARRHREIVAGPLRDEPHLENVTTRELCSILDEEIASLPEKYGGPIVLCYLEGKSHEVAARELGWPKTSLESRLTKARELLRRKLERRGVTLAIAALPTALGEMAAAAPLPATLTIKTVKAATLVASGKAVASGCFSATVLALAEETIAGMFWLKAKLVVMALAVGLAVGSAGWAGYKVVAGTGAPGPGIHAQVVGQKKQVEAAAKEDKVVAKDLFGDPLPEGGIARLGTIRFRQYGPILVDFAVGGKVITSTGLISGVRFWDAETGKQVVWLQELLGAQTIVFSNDGKLAAFEGKTEARDDWTIWDVENNKRILQIPDTPEYVFFSRNGKTAAAVQHDGGDPEGREIQIWDIGARKELRRLKLLSLSGYCALSPDGKALATVGEDKSIRLWDVATGHEIQKFTGNDSKFRTMTFSPDGKLLAAGGQGPKIQGWDVATGKALRQMKGEEYWNTVSFSPDGKVLASARMREGIIHLWDPNTGQELRRWDSLTRGQINIAFSPDGNTLISGSQYGSVIRKWDLGTGKVIGTSSAPGHFLGMAPQGRTLFAYGDDRILQEWDIRSGRLRQERRSNAPFPNGILALRPDGKALAMVAFRMESGPDLRTNTIREPLIRLFDTSTGKEIKTIQVKQGPIEIRFSPDGAILATVNDDGIRLFNAKTGHEIRHFSGPGTAQAPLAFSEDGRFLATAWNSHTLCLFDIATGRESYRWEHAVGDDKSYYLALALSQDGQALAAYMQTHSDEKVEGQYEIRSWSTSTGKELSRFGGLPISMYAHSIGFSASGRILAAGDADKIYICDAISGQLIRRFEGVREGVHSLVFTPDGRTLVSGHGDGTVLVWDMTSLTKDGKSKQEKLTDKDLERLWNDLASDGVKADAAIWTLARAPHESMTVLQARLLAIPKADAKQVAKWLAELDSDQFAIREKATRALEELGEGTEQTIRKALDASSSLELRKRLERILDYDKQNKEKAILRRLYAIEAVEHIGTLGARQLLETLRTATPNPRVAAAADAAQKRLTLQEAGNR